MKRRLGYLCCSLFAGCGGAYAATMDEQGSTTGSEAPMTQVMTVDPEDASLIESYPAEMDDLAVQLDEAMPLSMTQLDCESAGRIKDRICDLARRICTISERHPADESVREKCSDGQTRCERAERDIGNRCG